MKGTIEIFNGIYWETPERVRLPGHVDASRGDPRKVTIDSNTHEYSIGGRNNTGIDTHIVIPGNRDKFKLTNSDNNLTLTKQDDELLVFTKWNSQPITPCIHKLGKTYVCIFVTAYDIILLYASMELNLVGKWLQTQIQKFDEEFGHVQEVVQRFRVTKKGDAQYSEYTISGLYEINKQIMFGRSCGPGQ